MSDANNNNDEQRRAADPSKRRGRKRKASSTSDASDSATTLQLGSSSSSSSTRLGNQDSGSGSGSGSGGNQSSASFRVYNIGEQVDVYRRYTGVSPFPDIRIPKDAVLLIEVNQQGSSSGSSSSSSSSGQLGSSSGSGSGSGSVSLGNQTSTGSAIIDPNAPILRDFTSSFGQLTSSTGPYAPPPPPPLQQSTSVGHLSSYGFSTSLSQLQGSASSYLQQGSGSPTNNDQTNN